MVIYQTIDKIKISLNIAERDKDINNNKIKDVFCKSRQIILKLLQEQRLMKKIFFLISFLFVLSDNSYAQFDLNESSSDENQAVLSLQGGIVRQDTISSDEEEKSSDEESNQEDKGIFSFMDFSFLKGTTPRLTAAPNERQETFVQRISRQAEEGNIDAQLTLGYMYLYGKDGVEKNYDKAFKYYNMAAKQNDSVAINNVGSLYFSGIGTPRSLSKAAAMFEKASQLGNTEAAVNLSFIYLTKDSAMNNPQAAIQLLKSASEAGNPTAKFMLGYAYFKGFIVEKNYKKAMALIREAANAKYDDAEYMLGYLYLKGLGITKNYGNAVKYFRRASDQGNVDAMLELGNILAAGTMYTQDLYRAHILFNIASVHGVSSAVEKRYYLDKKMKIEDVLQAQSEAENYKARPSELTSYIKQTFGENIRNDIDDNLSKVKRENRGINT